MFYSKNADTYSTDIMKLLLVIILIFLAPLNIFSLDELIIIGREDRWNSLLVENNLERVTGKRGFLDLVLQDAEYARNDQTDMLLHFNFHPPVDSAGNYTVLTEKEVVTPDRSVYGKGSALFKTWSGGIELEPRQGSLFFPGTDWDDFTIEFWLYPAGMENGETIFYWQGRDTVSGESKPQIINCYFEDRRLVWEFTNFFLPPASAVPREQDYIVECRGLNDLIPKEWHHHSIRYDASIGLLEYYVDTVPEAVTHTTESGNEERTIYLPSIGEYSRGTVFIGDYYTGFIDEFRIIRSYLEEPVSTTYRPVQGTAITRPIDLQYTNSRLISIDSEENKPQNSDVYYFYNLSNDYEPLSPASDQWKPFEPGTLFEERLRGRFLQVMVHLFPDGHLEETPSVSEIAITYEPDTPPPPPSLVTATAGKNSVTLNWKPVAEADIGGYIVYYGTSSGRYFGETGSLGASPIDVGNTTTVTLEGLANGTLYFFSVVAYDSSEPPHVSTFSTEVTARPTSLGYKQ